MNLDRTRGHAFFFVSALSYVTRKRSSGIDRLICRCETWYDFSIGIGLVRVKVKFGVLLCLIQTFRKTNWLFFFLCFKYCELDSSLQQLAGVIVISGDHRRWKRAGNVANPLIGFIEFAVPISVMNILCNVSALTDTMHNRDSCCKRVLLCLCFTKGPYTPCW